MKLILITPPYSHPNEIEILSMAYELGVDRIHIRKPTIDEKTLRTYLDKLGEKIMARASLHYYENLMKDYSFSGFHFSSNNWKEILDEENEFINDDNILLSSSFHHPNEIQTKGNGLDYAFCSPVFPSISKEGYLPSFEWDVGAIAIDIQGMTQSHPLNTPKLELYALGGITSQKVAACKVRGFQGVAVLGAIWNQKTMKEAINELEAILK
ncbi:MAG: thiamine-phosphate pyrophosphorylase [Maribacter sp.]|jgi:thiamine-phosphate pyrophosphorylase